MAKGKRRRKVLLVLGITTLSILMLLLAVPLWFPYVLMPVLGKLGGTYKQYHRAGYSQFVLSTANLTNGPVRFSAERLEAKAPTAWAWNVLVNHGNSRAEFLKVTDWKLAIQSSPGGQKTETSTYSIVSNVSQQLGTLQRWLPSAEFSQGTLQVADLTVQVAALKWDRGLMELKGSLPVQGYDFAVSADCRNPQQIRINSQSEALHLLFDPESGPELDYAQAAKHEFLLEQSDRSWS